MKKWIVRFGSLLVFNVVVLMLIGWLTPAHVGWAALWAGIVMTILVIWVKPLVAKWFGSMAAKSAHERTKAGEWVVQVVLTLAVAFVVWILTVLLSGVSVSGWFWGYVAPPVVLLIGWAIYAAIDDKVEAQASILYDRATGGTQATAPDAAAPSGADQSGADQSGAGLSGADQAGRRELNDGLTDEQRKMLDDLG